MRKLTCPPEVEVLGVNSRALVDNIQGHQFRPIMKKYGLVDADPASWYPAIDFLNVMNEVFMLDSRVLNMVAIGMKIGEITPLPIKIENPTLPDVLMVWDDLYQSLHRNADVGYIKCDKVAQKHYRTIHADIYPDDMNYGILYAFGKRFLPTGTDYTVFYDPDSPTRDYGGTVDATIIHIEWE